jgi:hypothetical protein
MANRYLYSAQTLSTATWYDAASDGFATTAPGNGDTIFPNGFILTWDCANQLRLPTSGTLAGIDGTGGGNIALSVAAQAPLLDVAQITNGQNGGGGVMRLVNITNATGSFTLQNGAGGKCMILGGITNGCRGLELAANLGTITVYANATGGSGTAGNRHAIHKTGTSAMTLYGDVTGSSDYFSNYGFSNDGGNVTHYGNRIDGSKSVAWAGQPGNWSPTASNYILTNGVYATLPPAQDHVLKTGTPYYTKDGTGLVDGLASSGVPASRIRSGY